MEKVADTMNPSLLVAADDALSQEVDQDRLVSAYQAAVHDLLAERNSLGHWTGQLSTSALSTATAVSALSVVLRRVELTGDHQILAQPLIDADAEVELDPVSVTAAWTSLRDTGLQWLIEHQNADGGWGDTDLSYSNISTTMLTVAAIDLAGKTTELADQVSAARQYIDSQGGVDGLRKRYGKDKTFAVPILANCAIAGQVPWREVSPLPFEAAWVPQKFYRWMQLPVVSYAIPALVAIGQARYFHAPPRNPVTRAVRSRAVQPTLAVLEKMQPASGGYLEAIPLTCFVVMGLASSEKESHGVVRNGLRFVWESVRADGSWPIDTNLATWNTTLSVNALSIPLEESSGEGEHHGSHPEACKKLPTKTAREAIGQDRLLEWVLSCQYQVRHPFTGAEPGGWGWSDLSGAVPDADDTPGALLALSELRRKFNRSPEIDRRIVDAARNGLQWLTQLQNRDGGWPTFCRGWGKLPFDRSGSDLTAHALRAFAAWESEFGSDPQWQERYQKSRLAAEKYLAKQQAADGSWLPLWFGNQDQPNDENPVYGTAKVLMALRDLKLTETSMASRGLAWLKSAQNSDGGWGGAPSIPTSRDSLESGKPGVTFASSVEETALAVEAWLGFVNIADKTEELPESRESTLPAGLAQGVAWLVDAVENGTNQQASPIGFYFAKLWYYEQMYPLIFTTAALGAAVRVGGELDFRLS